MINAKISSTFRNLLDSRKPTDLIKVVLVLDLGAIVGSASKKPDERRLNAQERKVKSGRLASAASSAEVNSLIDGLLNRHQATRMSEKLTSMGTLLVEAPTSSVLEFEQEPLVRAILENQSVKVPTQEAND